MARTSFYVTVMPNWSAYNRTPDGEPKLSGITARRLTQKRPQGGRVGEVVIKLTVEVPDSAFYPLRPEATVIIPEALVDTLPVTVAALDPEMELLGPDLAPEPAKDDE